MQPFYLLLIGLAGGGLGGLLGVGGGLITVPALHLLLDKSMHVAIAASLFSNAVVGAASAWRFSKQGRVVWPWVWRILAGASLGGIVGITAASHLSQSSLRVVFAGFMILAALDLLARGRATVQDDGRAPPPDWRAAPWVGIPTGLAAGLMGVGGGIVAVPLQRRLFKMPIKIAIGNSSATIPFTCVLAGSLALKGFQDADPREILMTSAFMACGGLAGALLSATLSGRVPGKALRVLFGVFLLLSAAKMLA